MRSFTILLIVYVHQVSSNRLYDVPITVNSDFRLMAPSTYARSKQDLPSHISTFLEDDWAKGFYEPGCSDDNIKIIPIYFWPGDKIDLPCAMCDIAFLLNGKVKNWGWARNIPEFLENPQKIVVSDSSKWSVLANFAYQENPDIEKPSYASDEESAQPHNYFPYYPSAVDKNDRIAADNVFYQHDGILSILFSSASSQGVYFCFDKDSIGSVSYFYVLMAMTPAVLIGASEAFTDGCVLNNQFFPHHNWQFHFFPGARVNLPEKCATTTDDVNSPCSTEYERLYTQINDFNSLNECSLEHCLAELHDPYDSHIELNVAVELRWDSWSGCRNGMPSERREGHCYLIRKNGKTIPEEVTSAVSWISELNSVFDHEPFSSNGIRLYSSLIAWLIIGETERRPQCFLNSEEQTIYDDVFKNVIFKSMGYKVGNGQLKNAFQICLSSGSFEENNSFFQFSFYKSNYTRSYAIGSYMTETRPCY